MIIYFFSFKKDNCGIPVQTFATQFFLSGFMYNLPFDTAVRIWDSFWLRQFDFIFAVGIAIMKLCKRM